LLLNPDLLALAEQLLDALAERADGRFELLRGLDASGEEVADVDGDEAVALDELHHLLHRGLKVLRARAELGAQERDGGGGRHRGRGTARERRGDARLLLFVQLAPGRVAMKRPQRLLVALGACGRRRLE